MNSDIFKTTIYLIRHGESEDNKNSFLSGARDVGLSARGKAQCIALGSVLKDTKIDHVFHSPMKRAKESAGLIFPEVKADALPFLRELNYGEYEGFDLSQYSSSKDEIIRKWVNDPSELVFPGGDSIPEFCEYTLTELTKLAELYKGKAIACVSHRSAIRLLAAKILHLDLGMFRRIPCSNCGITELSWNVETGFKAESINAVFPLIRNL